MFSLPVSTNPSIGRLTLRLTGFVSGRLWLQVPAASVIDQYTPRSGPDAEAVAAGAVC